MCALAALEPAPNAVDFINDDALHALLTGGGDAVRAREIIAKSLAKEALTVEETACLLNVRESDVVEEILAGARELKKRIYGKRIVLFAPLYVGNDCVNDCAYCAFRRSNDETIRRTLSEAELAEQVRAMEQRGHKRLILVFGEHPSYDARFIARCVEQVYATRVGRGEIRRVNINAAPLDHEGYRIVKAAKIGTYQIFQETYHHDTYAKVHGRNTRKGHYLYRLDGPSRAVEVGCDDVGIGALFGLYDWRFEVLGLVSHARHLQDRHGAGPHTVSFPRLRPACGVRLDERWLVNDADFQRLIATLRLAVPYTGLILTARESPAVRKAALAFGVSQIDAGSRIEIGGYTEAGDAQVMEREQFSLGDIRSLDAVIGDLLGDGYIPSFCTACYRLGRTGQHFMELAIPGFIQKFCDPNALSTLMEYLVDYATPETRAAGLKLIDAELAAMEDSPRKAELSRRLKRIQESEDRDLYF